MVTESYSPVIRQDRLSLQVSDQIQGLILTKEINIGDRLPAERELCEKFQVSRTVIREAIRILEAKGLLVSQGGSGTYVRGIQSKDVSDSLGMYIFSQGQKISHDELMEVRRILEIQIARLATERATPDVITDLEDVLSKMCEQRGDPDEFAHMDLDFHLGLASATQNPLLVVLLDPFVDALYEERRLASQLPGVTDEACMLHQEILDRVKAHDPEGAAQAMAKHLEQSNRVIGRALRELSNEKKQNNGLVEKSGDNISMKG